MKRPLAYLGALCLCSTVIASDQDRFVGRVVVEWLDDDPFIPQMKLLEDFAYQDAAGKRWLAPREEILDGRCLPLLFKDLVGAPFVGQYRKSSIVYDYYCRSMNEPWKDVNRMFYRASLTEGLAEADAKWIYGILYASGSRWEVRGSRCFASCHASASTLTWRPVIDQAALAPVLDWIRQTQPALDEIDQRLDATIRKPGPHIFAYAQ